MLNKAIYIIFFLVIIAIPFTDFDGLKALGEHKQDLAAHILLFGVGVFYIKVLTLNRYSIFKSYIYNLYVLLFIWCIVIFLINFNEIFTSELKGRTGLKQSINQMLIFGMSIFGFIPFFNHVIRNYSSIEIIFKIRKFLYYTFLFVFFFSTIEVLVGHYHISSLKPLYNLLWSLINRQSKSETTWILNRITGVTYEPPYLAMYLMVVLPFMLSFLYDKPKKAYTAVLILILAILCGSRTALIVCLIELVIFLALLLRYVYNIGSANRFIEKGIIVLLIVSPFVGGVIIEKASNTINSLIIKNESKHGTLNISNATRVGTQVAGVEIFSQNPITGVGLGQQGFYLVKTYPKWAIKLSYELRDMYIDTKSPIWPPGYSLYTRLLAETGIIGFILFFGNSFLLVVICFIKLRKSQNIVPFTIIITLLIGLLINFMQFDSLRMIPFWLTVTLAINTIQQSKNEPK